MTWKHRENKNLVSFICFSFLIIITTIIAIIIIIIIIIMSEFSDGLSYLHLNLKMVS